MRRIALAIIDFGTRVLLWELGWHAGWGSCAKCKSVVLDHCHETSFCPKGRRLFVAIVDITQVVDVLQKEAV